MPLIPRLEKFLDSFGKRGREDLIDIGEYEKDESRQEILADRLESGHGLWMIGRYVIEAHEARTCDGLWNGEKVELEEKHDNGYITNEEYERQRNDLERSRKER